MSKNSCPISRVAFRGNAKPLNVKIADRDYTSPPKEFSTGSLGYNVNDKLTVKLPGVARTKGDFSQLAKPIPVVIGGRQYLAMPKEFSTGSLGWNLNDKVTLDIGGVAVQVQVGGNLTITKSKESWTPGDTHIVQVGLNLTIIGSKDLPQG